MIPFLLIQALQAGDYLASSDLYSVLNSGVQGIASCPGLEEGVYSVQLQLDGGSELVELSVSTIDGEARPSPCWEEVLRKVAYPAHAEDGHLVLWKLAVQDGGLYVLPGLQLMQRAPALPGFFLPGWDSVTRRDVQRWLLAPAGGFPVAAPAGSSDLLEPSDEKNEGAVISPPSDSPSVPIRATE